MDATGMKVGVVTSTPATITASELTATGGSTAAPTNLPAGNANSGPAGDDASDLPPEVTTRRIRDDEALLLRSLRLMALRDAPEAFAGGVAEELAVDATEWACRSRDCASRQDDFLAIVNRLGTPSGLVRVYTPPTEPSQRELAAMWVAPWARGMGAGDALVEAAIGWAEQVGAAIVALWVNVANTAAQQLYARHGFTVVGEPAGDPDERRWLRMCRLLRASGAEPVRLAPDGADSRDGDAHDGDAHDGDAHDGDGLGTRVRW